jgi:hypothetical protein
MMMTQFQPHRVYPAAGSVEQRMGGAVRSTGWEVALRAAAVACALLTASCGSIVNMMPDPRDFHLPDTKTFAPTAVSAYARPVSAKEDAGPGELVDGNGYCAGPPGARSNDAPPDAPPAPTGSVALEMTECQVSRALGPPQQTQISGDRGLRVVDMTYIGGERSGIYHFMGGRLATIERGAEPPPPPPVAKKPPAKKPKPPAPPPA